MTCVRGSLTAAIILLTALAIAAPSGAETCAEWVGKAVSVQGDVQALSKGETQWKAVQLNDTYCPSDTIRVQERSRADILLANDSILRLDQKSTITFSGPEEEKTFLINLKTGIVHFFSRFRRSLKVTTPFVNATVEGTEFLVRVESDRTYVSVFEGKVEFKNEKGVLLIASGQSAEAVSGQAPVIRVVARPREAVQWTLYYPPVFPLRPAEYKAGADWKEKVSYLLSVGRVDEANREIEEVLRAAPQNSDALAVQSVIALVQNDKDRALALSKKAVDSDPDSSAARIALSYALQARFDLKGALEALKEAVKLEPKNALAWARLAEIHLSFGDLEEALNAAKKAVALNPDTARSQTVLGFAHLTRVETDAAKAAFEKAIVLDQADPLPRLGLGLAKIRKGRLEEGRREIEVAGSLDPDNSIIRSYLGKSYYEEKRDEKASEQFSRAKEFDPLDPTPWFYDAIRKQSTNRPVEALHDIQRAMELNDNRAVYRSRFLLDEDLAARSASLARIYSDLGFGQLALVEGWKSVNTDPASHSAHRFLADSYSVLPRHEIARVSELLQSQLLQPINITPVQPELAESNLFILNGAGPSDLSFNEFNPLFNRNRIGLQVSGVAGSNSTFGEEVVVSAVKDKFSISAGQFHYETDGFRENNDLKTDIYNVFAQYRLSDKTSVQAEFRAKDKENGDLTLNFDPNNFFPTKREKEQSRSIRFGFRHSLTPSSDVIVSGIYKKLDDNASIAPAFAVDSEDSGFMVEAQYLFRKERFHLISGAGYFSSDIRDMITTFLLIPPMPPITSVTVNEGDIRHNNLYIYAHINCPAAVTWTLGGSADFFRGILVDRDQFNPKLGVTWRPYPSTTLRAAVFRTLKRSLISDQTIEPTQVAGFNQFFDDGEGTDVWRYGLAIDQKFTPDLQGGLEFSRRELKVPFEHVEIPPPPASPIPTVELRKADWDESVVRGYFYWTPHKWVALSAEYQYERFERGDTFGPENIETLKTHKLPLRVSFHHPAGIGAWVKATYVDQKGVFFDQFLLSTAKDNDRFWVVDASVGYRLPKRLGVVSIEARNLLDAKFKFQDTDPANPSIFPKRVILGKLTLAF